MLETCLVLVVMKAELFFDLKKPSSQWHRVVLGLPSSSSLFRLMSRQKHSSCRVVIILDSGCSCSLSCAVSPLQPTAYPIEADTDDSGRNYI